MGVSGSVDFYKPFGTESKRYICGRGSLRLPLTNQATNRMEPLHSAPLGSTTKHYLNLALMYNFEKIWCHTSAQQ
jgi:hypothetical protein